MPKVLIHNHTVSLRRKKRQKNNCTTIHTLHVHNIISCWCAYLLKVQTRSKDWIFDENIHRLMFISLLQPSLVSCWAQQRPSSHWGLVWSGSSSFLKERVDDSLPYSSLEAWSKESIDGPSYSMLLSQPAAFQVISITNTFVCNSLSQSYWSRAESISLVNGWTLMSSDTMPRSKVLSL